MSFCPDCKKDFPDTVRFCQDCGAKLSPKPPPQAQAQAQSQQAAEPAVKVQDGVVTGGIHISTTDSRTIIRQQDETREVLTCELCGAHVPKPEGFTCPKCSRFICANDYRKELKLCAACFDFQATAAINQYGTLLDKVMQDGRIDSGERAQLDRARLALGLDADVCAKLENERRAAAVSRSGDLGRREKALLDEAYRLLFGSFEFEEALKAVRPLYERFGDRPEVRKTYLLALLEADPGRAREAIEGMRFDDIEKSLAHMELLARGGDFDRAYDLLKDARQAFGAAHPELTACEADLVLEECRRTGHKSLLDVAAECLARADASSSEYARYAQAFLGYVRGDARALDSPAQAGNYYARRKKQWIARSAESTSARKETAHKESTNVQSESPPDHTTPLTPPPPIVPMPAMMPGVWQLRLVAGWGQTYYGTCQVTVSGFNVMMVVDVSGQVMLWDGLLHYFQDRSIFRGGVSGNNLFATCSEVVRMVDGMVVPVPGLPARLNALIAGNGRSLSGTVVNALGESSQVFLTI